MDQHSDCKTSNTFTTCDSVTDSDLEVNDLSDCESLFDSSKWDNLTESDLEAINYSQPDENELEFNDIVQEIPAIKAKEEQKTEQNSETTKKYVKRKLMKYNSDDKLVPKNKKMKDNKE
jgi:hypothetical protein